MTSSVARQSRRRFAQFVGRVVTGSVAAPFVNRLALGQTLVVRLARFAQIYPIENEAWNDFVRQLRAATNDTIIVSLADAPQASVSELLGSDASEAFSGIYGSAGLFAAAYRVYDPPDPGFLLLGNTLAAFDSFDQQAEWFESGGGTQIARSVYGTRVLFSVGTLPYFKVRLIVHRPLNSVEDLRGLRVIVQRGFTADLLVHAGVEPRYLDIPQSANQPDPDGAVGGSLGPRAPSAPGFVLNAPVWMETRDILLGVRAMRRLSTAQLAVLEQHVRLHAAALRSLFSQQEEQWFGQLASQGTTIVEWPAAERMKLKALTNRFLRAWASGGPPGARGGPIVRERLVSSIEQFQRERGLI